MTTATPDLQRWKVTVAYDGQPFSGWQSQPSGDTIQDHLEEALAQINGMPAGTRIHGSGRTDAGVHAEGQVAHFDAPAALSLSEASWPRALNVHLPPSIRVMDAQAVSQDFHARFSVVEKTYTYKIYLGSILPPHFAGRWGHFPLALDVDAMAVAAAHLQGTHDFRAFAANRGPGCPEPTSTVRKLREIKVTEEAPHQWILRFTADGFLYRMVRMLTGTMVRFAHGRLPESELLTLIEGTSEVKTSACAPAAGLYLAEVRYGKPTAHPMLS